MNVFAYEFVLVGLHHKQLKESPQGVTPTYVANRLMVPNLGAVRQDCYTRGDELFCRLYHVESGMFAWYIITDTLTKEQRAKSH